jgi:hypothetical protein
MTIAMMTMTATYCVREEGGRAPWYLQWPLRISVRCCSRRRRRIPKSLLDTAEEGPRKLLGPILLNDDDVQFRFLAKEKKILFRRNTKCDMN